MLPIYPGVLRGDQIEWTGDAPPTDKPVKVHVTIVGLVATFTDDERRQRLQAALQRIVASGVYRKFADPLEWQQEQRRDRRLPGRES